VHQATPVPFASCRHCDGIWFSREAIDKGGKPVLPPLSKQRRTKVAPAMHRACPQCSIELDAESVDDVVIDICSRCGGVWLDPGEYQAARRRSIRLRFARDVPSLRKSSSRAVKLVDRIIDAVGERLTEEELEDFDMKKLIPRKRRGSPE
jgi:Zn-finger nucleic acid-binding protein